MYAGSKIKEKKEARSGSAIEPPTRRRAKTEVASAPEMGKEKKKHKKHKTGSKIKDLLRSKAKSKKVPDPADGHKKRRKRSRIAKTRMYSLSHQF